MKLTRKFTIHLQLFIYANLVNCFSIDSPEKIGKIAISWTRNVHFVVNNLNDCLE